jgi:CheY-like chemotaxis protein
MAWWSRWAQAIITNEAFAIAVPGAQPARANAVQKESLMARKRILSVGQCAADHAALRWAFRPHFDAELVSVPTGEAAVGELRRGTYDLVLVNRILDADGAPGVDVIRQIRAEEAFRLLPIMLVSNHEDAQEEAVQAGAVPGFGKEKLNDPQTEERLRPYLG